MNRIDQVFATCKTEKRAALIPYITCGDPTLAFTEQVVEQLAVSGADIIELGMPFSDPMADGKTIQEACTRALAHGVTLTEIFDMVSRLRARGVKTPFILFSYYNVLFGQGIEVVAKRCAEAGIDGWLTVDMPIEEVDEILPVLNACGLVWIPLTAPTTSLERIEAIQSRGGGFLYYIMVTGVTGARSGIPEGLAKRLADVRRASKLPVAAGFGVSSPEMVAEIAAHADAVVVGSRLVDLLHTAYTEESPDTALTKAGVFIRAMADALPH
ncbi:MAG: tryptophan synthase subunit alpha [Spartobacteria bacterium]|nr:tryptophan synthase subunit alpha [Spartobacteria bacterium]